MFSLVGKKVGMSQVFSEGGDLVPVTVIEVQPNLVVDLKTKERDGYESTCVGYGEIREALVNKPNAGQYKKANQGVRRRIYELKGLEAGKFAIGDKIELWDLFKVGDLVDIQGKTRGHGFTGAIKLWNFRCGPKAHGAGYPHRFGGSLETGRGGSAPQKVWKGKKMSGRYGNETVTAVNLEVVLINEEKRLMFVKGCIPGRPDSIVKIKSTTRKNKSVAEPFKIYSKQQSAEVANNQ